MAWNCPVPGLQAPSILILQSSVSWAGSSWSVSLSSAYYPPTPAPSKLKCWNEPGLFRQSSWSWLQLTCGKRSEKQGIIIDQLAKGNPNMKIKGGEKIHKIQWTAFIRKYFQPAAWWSVSVIKDSKVGLDKDKKAGCRGGKWQQVKTGKKPRVCFPHWQTDYWRKIRWGLAQDRAGQWKLGKGHRHKQGERSERHFKRWLSEETVAQGMRYTAMMLNNGGCSNLDLFWNCFGTVTKDDSGKTKGGISTEVGFCGDFGRKEAIAAFHFFTFFPLLTVLNFI